MRHCCYWSFISATGEDKTRNRTENRKDKYKKNYTEPGKQVLIVYGTEYGFSEEVAKYVFDRCVYELNKCINNNRVDIKLLSIIIVIFL